MHPLIEQVTRTFQQRFQTAPTFIARAPGRVNLLGEHIDYNDGWVLPAAIDRATYIAVGPRADVLATIRALDLSMETTVDTTQLEAKVDVNGKPLPSWAKYPAGTAWALQALKLSTPGLNAVFASDVPRGAGLSSSASVEVAFATAWQHLGGWALTSMAKAQASQRAENDYVGVNCGLMDQFASACGQAGYALLLDCRTLDWETVPLPTDTVIVVADTMARRELGKSEYNTRRAQCEEAVSVLRKVLPHPITALRDVSLEEFNQHAHLLDPIVEKRARHVVEECARVQAAIHAMRTNNAPAFGTLMNACHTSLRDLYAVSCKELDVMVAAAQDLPGCYGARLTGAGFGGCTVNLVAADKAEGFKITLAERYETATGKHPEIYVCQAASGATIEN